MVENRPNLKSMLRHEELASKERATAVMNRIMAAGSKELKVNGCRERDSMETRDAYALPVDL